MTPIHSTGNMNMGSSQACVKAEGTHSQFPAGLRVLVVDDDPTCLKILDKMLRRCLYEVTTCSLATVALSMLREKKGSFDLVISDVYMPDMDGFKLLEHVGLEMDLPVIMMSADSKTSVVMKGIKHGACDYLIKPVRMEELQNIWQHVIRKKRNEAKELEHSGSVEDGERLRKGLDDVDYASSVNEAVDWKLSKKRKELREEEEDGNQESDDPSSLKKPRVVWSVELHQQFVNAVSQLGIDKAFPKKILEMMNVQGLTRENVASHLQKYRLFLKRLSGGAHQQGGMNSFFGVSTETNFGSMDSFGRIDLHALVASGKISPQTLVAVQPELSPRANSNNGPGMPEEALFSQAGLQRVNSNPLNSLTFGQSLMKSQVNILQSLPSHIEMNPFDQIQQNTPSFGNMEPSMDESSGFSMLQQQLTTADVGPGDLSRICGINKNEPLNLPNNVVAMQLRHQQQQQQQHQYHQHLQLQQHAQLEGAQLQGGHAHNLSSTNFLRPQVLSDDIGGATMSLSTMTNCSTSLGDSVIGASKSIQGNCISPAVCDLPTPASSAHVGIGRLPVDYKNHDLPSMLGNSFSLSNTIGSSAPLTPIGAEAVTHMPILKSLGNIRDSSQALRGPSFNFCTFSVLGQNIDHNVKQGWQVHNTSHSLDLSQTISPVLGQGYSRAAPGFQELNVPWIQDQEQIKSLGFVGRGLGLPNKFASDAEHHRVIGNVQCQGDQTLAANISRVKGEDVSDMMGYSKIDGSLFSEQFSPSYDITDLLFKQNISSHQIL